MIYNLRNYKIVERLRGGASASIYKAEVIGGIEDYYILKHATNKEDIEMLINEHDIISGIRNKKGLITEVVGYEERVTTATGDVEEAVLISSYAQCGDLHQLIGETCSIEQFMFKCWVAQKMRSALWLLFNEDICHLDIKPSNFFWNYGDIWLGDFGLARKTNPFGIILLPVSLGTQGYQSPEILEREFENEHLLEVEYSFYTDLWAFAITLHELFYGCKPYALEYTYGSWLDMRKEHLKVTTRLKEHGLNHPLLQPKGYRFEPLDELLNRIFTQKITIREAYSHDFFNFPLDYALIKRYFNNNFKF